MRSNQGETRVESELGITTGLGTPNALATEPFYNVNVDNDLEPASYVVVTDSSCSIQTVFAGLVDSDVAHARSMMTRQQPPNREEEGVGSRKNRRGRTTK